MAPLHAAWERQYRPELAQAIGSVLYSLEFGPSPRNYIPQVLLSLISEYVIPTTLIEEHLDDITLHTTVRAAGFFKEDSKMSSDDYDTDETCDYEQGSLTIDRPEIALHRRGECLRVLKIWTTDYWISLFDGRPEIWRIYVHV